MLDVRSRRSEVGGENLSFHLKKDDKKWESFIKDIDKKSLTFYNIEQLFYIVEQEKRVC